MSEPEFPARPASEGSLPPAPTEESAWGSPSSAPSQESPWASPTPAPATGSPWASPPAAGSSSGWGSQPEPPTHRRGRPQIVVAAVLALALIAGAGTYLFLRGRGGAASGPATPLTLAFERGDETTYDLHMTMDGSLDMGSAGSQPLKMDVNESVGWRVVKVDKDGTATIRLSVGGVSGAVNGMPVPADAGTGSSTLRITPDGRIVDSSGQTLGSTSGSPMGGFPGMDQVTPILPDHPVAPGDSWDKRFSQELPFGQTKLEYTAHSTFDRYESVGGVRAAVITTTYEVPMRFSIDLGDVGSMFGAQGAPSPGKKATIAYDGSGSFTQTSWLDLGSKQLLRGSSSGTFDLTMTIPGLEAETGTDSVSMSAEFTFDITRR